MSKGRSPCWFDYRICGEMLRLTDSVLNFTLPVWGELVRPAGEVLDASTPRGRRTGQDDGAEHLRRDEAGFFRLFMWGVATCCRGQVPHSDDREQTHRVSPREPEEERHRGRYVKWEGAADPLRRFAERNAARVRPWTTETASVRTKRGDQSWIRFGATPRDWTLRPMF